MTAPVGRSLLWLLIGSLLLSAGLWLAFPLWIAPLARTVLARAGADLIELEVRRPGLTRLEVERLVLTQDSGRVELLNVQLSWRLDGNLTLLRIGRLKAQIGTGATNTFGSHAPNVELPDPGSLLAALPVEHIEIAAADVEFPSFGLRYTGSLTASREQAHLDGAFASRALPDPLGLRGEFDGVDRLRMHVRDRTGVALLDANLRIATQADALDVEGSIEIRTALLPALLPDTPGIAGTALFMTRIAPGELHLHLLPGTRLATAGGTPAFAARIEATEPWALSWREGRFASAGVLDVALTATLPSDSGSPARELGGRLRIAAVGGTPMALAVEATGEFSGRSGEFTMRGELESNVLLEPGLRVTLAPPSGLHAVKFENQAAQQRLEGVDLRLETPTTIDLATLAWSKATLSAGAQALILDAKRIDLSALRMRTDLSGTVDAPQLRLDVDGAGLAVRARGRLVAQQPMIDIARGRIEAGSGTLLSALVRSFAPRGFELRAGALEVEHLRWPPAPHASITVTFSQLSAATPDVILEGLDAQLELDVSTDTTRFVLTDARLRRLIASAVRGEHVEFSAEGRLAGWNIEAAARGAMPTMLLVDALALQAERIATEAQQLKGLRVTGTARLARNGTTAALQATAPTLNASVPATDLRCGIDLELGVIELRNCGLSLLGGQIEVPAATIELETLNGYLPVALRGLDLGAVLLLMQDEALAGDGVLDGALPVRLGAGVATVRDGYVGARPPGGRLHYRANTALLERMNQPGLSLAMAALGDFRYRELGAYVDYEQDGTLGLRVRLAGASPKVEKGRPIEFNLDITQNLPLLLQSLKLSQTINDAIERRLQERNAP